MLRHVPGLAELAANGAVRLHDNRLAGRIEITALRACAFNGFSLLTGETTRITYEYLEEHFGDASLEAVADTAAQTARSLAEVTTAMQGVADAFATAFVRPAISEMLDDILKPNGLLGKLTGSGWEESGQVTVRSGESVYVAYDPSTGKSWQRIIPRWRVWLADRWDRLKDVFRRD